MPVDLLGLILFLTAVSPGYVYLRIAEARQPRPTRATLILTVEIFLIGSVFTAAGGLTVSAVMQVRYGLVERLLADPGAYLEEQYALVATWVATIVALAHLMAALVARVVYHKVVAGYSPGGSVWTEILARDHDVTLVLVSVHLTDARVISGYVSGFDLDAPGGERDLALQAPIFLQAPSGAPIRQRNLDRLIISADMIEEIGVRYEEAAAVLAS